MPDLADSSAFGPVRVAGPPASGPETLLLHACCAPCSSVTAPAWRTEGLEPVALFCNPNIAPAAEYARRLGAMRRLAEALALPLEEVTPGEDDRLRYGACGGEAPDRCRACIGHRLDVCAQRARELGVQRFATTLALSPYQPHNVIRAAGEEAGDRHGVEFLYSDQRELFSRHYEECRRLGIYRQPYCGCVPSKWEAWHQRRPRALRRAG